MQSSNRILKNYAYNSVYQVLNVILPFVTAPYIARTLLNTGVGINSYTNTIVQLCATLGLIGLNRYSIREMAYARDDEGNLNRVFWELLITRLIVGMVSCIIYYIYVQSTDYPSFSMFYGVYLISIFIDISWLFSGVENFKILMIRNLCVRTTQVVCVFFFIHNQNDLYLYILFTGGFALLGNIVLYFEMKKYIGRMKFDRRMVLQHIKASFKLFLPQIATIVYLQLGKLIIKACTGDIVLVGFYDQADKIIKIPITLISAFSAVMMPRLSNEFINNRKGNIEKYLNLSLKFSLMGSVPIMFGLIAISDGFIEWFLGIEFILVAPLIKILSLTVVFIALTNVSGAQFLISTGKHRLLTKSYLICSFMYLLIIYPSIQIAGVYGAAFSALLTEAMVFFIQYYMVRDEMPIKRVIKYSLKYFVAGLCMFVICVALNPILPGGITRTVVQIGAGILVYFGVLILLKDDLIKKVISKSIFR